MLYTRSMNTKTFFSLQSVLAAITVAGGVVSAAPSDDFAALKAHWNFDEGRDWHNMPMPYQSDAVCAANVMNFCP